jgi:hypothetical protein
MWCISGNASATRLLGIVVVLKAVALYEGMCCLCHCFSLLIDTSFCEEYAAAANSVISFYTASLSSCLGEAYHPPSLPYLASLWFQGSSKVTILPSVETDFLIGRQWN